jgi:hypothetical protein
MIHVLQYRNIFVEELAEGHGMGHTKLAVATLDCLLREQSHSYAILIPRMPHTSYGESARKQQTGQNQSVRNA